MQAWPWLWKIANAAAADRRRQLRIVEHDVGALAAQLELHALQIPGRRLDDLAPDGGRSGERDLVDAGMFGQVLARGRAVAGHDIDHAARDADLAAELGDLQLDSGVSSAGFITTVLPAASAGPIFQLVNISGKFQGTIWPTTPSGSRST